MAGEDLIGKGIIPPSSGGGGSGSAQAKDIPHAAGVKGAVLATKLFGVPDLQKFGEVGIQQSFGGDTQGISNKMLNEAAASLSMKGGFLAKVFDELKSLGMQIIDHTGGIQQLAWTEVPIEALGQILPPNTPGSGVAAGEGFSMNA
ncbi:MAG: hypothetical protein SFW63_00165 [Alphaproteobacteria bacterium]|nr:hypothetical protein [Alphaproteobacteria bacterium]